MQNNTYTISELSKKFNESKQVVRRRIDSLEINSINRDIRAFPNEPLKYDIESYNKLALSFGVDIYNKNDDYTQRHADIHDDDTRSNADDLSKNLKNDALIEILERELKHSKGKLTKSEEEKEHLYRLLDQQQQLSLNDKNKIDQLEFKLENSKETKTIDEKTKNKKGFFSRLFNL